MAAHGNRSKSNFNENLSKHMDRAAPSTAPADTLKLKHYSLPTVPLYHAYYHGANETTDFIRNRTQFQKRTPADDILSKNISMVLEELLLRYENSHLPTHGQGGYSLALTCIPLNCAITTDYQLQVFRQWSRQIY